MPDCVDKAAGPLQFAEPLDLDHIWVTEPLVGSLARAQVFRDSRGWEQTSDHVPVMIELS